MRASLFLVVIAGLFACGEAELDLSMLKDLGANLVNGLVENVKGKLAEAGQKLLGSLLEKFGKRELLGPVGNVFKMLSGLFDHAKSVAGDVFGTAVGKLQAITKKFHDKLGMLKDTKQVNDEVDDVVAEHHVQQKRILSDLLQKAKDLFSGAVQTLKDAAGALKGHASELVSGLLQKGTDMLVGKRATLSDHLQKIGGAISSAVSPFKDIVAGLGTTLKGHFSNLVDTVKGHVTALKGKLSGHVDDLKNHGKTLLDHGKNALGALSEVVSDILKQTVNNAQPAIDGLAKTAAGAGNTILNHFTGADKTN